MKFSQALTLRYSSVAQKILCGPDTIASLCSTLDRFKIATALIVCGPSILHKSNVISRCGTYFRGVTTGLVRAAGKG